MRRSPVSVVGSLDFAAVLSFASLLNVLLCVVCIVPFVRILSSPEWYRFGVWTIPWFSCNVPPYSSLRWAFVFGPILMFILDCLLL